MAIKVDVDARQIKELASIIIRLYKEEFAEEMKALSNKFTQHIIRKHLMGGTTDTRLRVRTGHLRRTTTPIDPPEVKGDTIIGGTKFGAKYAKTHIGPKGSKTTIQGKPWLTIPLSPALTKAGVMKFPKARDYPDLFPIISRKGNLLLVQKQKSGGVIPFFVLKKSVTVPARLHPEEITAAFQPQVIEGMSKRLLKLINRVSNVGV